MKRKFLSVLLACTLAAGLLTGCSDKPSTDSATKDQPSKEGEVTTEDEATTEPEEMVELNFYIENSAVNEQDRIMEKANEIIGKEINAKLNLIFVDNGTYADKMNLMISTGDDWDLCFTAFWGGINFYENATNGAYADLTELLPKYAPQTYSRIPEALWDGVKVNGKIYASVNYQQWGTAWRKGFKFRKDIADEVGFDWKAVKGKSTIEAMTLIGPFLGKAKAKHPDMIGWETSSTYSFFANEPLMWDMEAVGDLTSPGWIRYTEPDTIINQYETEEFAKYCKIMREWFQKGYVREDGATVNDVNPDRQAAKIIAECSYGWPDSVDFPGNTDTEKMSMCTPDTAPARMVSTTRTVIPAIAGANAAVAINSQSKNIEKALELIELLNTNDELYMLITQGEEGIDYIYDEDGTFKQIEGKYNFNWNEWKIGQSYSPNFTRAIYDNNESGEKQKEAQGIVFEADKTADKSPVTGFIFDTTPVKTQLANCESITTELVPALSNGCVDPDKILPELLQRLEDAGVKDIIAEKQKQYDAWKANK